MMSTFGLNGSILMQMARRGGHRSGRKIRPGGVDGYLQAIRGSMMQEGGGKKKPAAAPKKPLPFIPPPMEVGSIVAEIPGNAIDTQKSPSRVAFTSKESVTPQPMV